MSGLINAAPAATANAQPATAGGLSNPLLQQMEAGIEAKLTPANKADYDKIVIAGLHIALDRGPQGFMAKLHDSADPIGDAAKGSVNLMLIMKKQARGQWPEEAGIPAAYTLMLRGLDFIDHSGVVKIGAPELARAIHLFSNQLFWRIGLTPKMLQTVTERVHAIVQNPDDMQKLNLKNGLSRHPDAAIPTAVPGLTAPPAA